MKVAVLGTGIVGQTIARKIASLGHDVVIGTRDVDAALARTESPGQGALSLKEFVEQHSDIRPGSFAESASHGEIVFNATSGTATIEVLNAAGAGNLEGKILIDITNPLDFSAGFPPTLTVANTDSLAEQIQRAFPAARVVKTLNTVSAPVMVDPAALGEGDHEIFVSGNDSAAKEEVARLLRDWFGWRHVVDLGDIASARGAEMYLALWVRLMGAVGSPMFNIKIVR